VALPPPPPPVVLTPSQLAASAAAIAPTVNDDKSTWGGGGGTGAGSAVGELVNGMYLQAVPEVWTLNLDTPGAHWVQDFDNSTLQRLYISNDTTLDVVAVATGEDIPVDVFAAANLDLGGGSVLAAGGRAADLPAHVARSSSNDQVQPDCDAV
jgi:hypothetical protein